MSKNLSKVYEVNQQPLRVKFSVGVVSLDFTARHLKNQLQGFNYLKLVKEIQHDYLNFYHQPLKISNSSFVAEIWGHLLAYRISLWVKKHIQLKPLQKIASYAAHRSGIADCGEAKLDTNRWIWDVMAWLFFRKYR